MTSMSMPDQNQSPELTWLQHYPSDVDWASNIRSCPVYELLDENVKQYGQRPAFDFLGKKWSWSDISSQVDRMAKGLQDMGVKKGDKIGIFLPNCTYFLIAYYAIMKAGAVVVNYNPLYAERELQHQIEDSETDYMVTLDLDMLCEKMHDMLQSTRLKKLIICSFTDILPFPKNVLFRFLKAKEMATLDQSGSYVFYKDLINNQGNPDLVNIDPVNDVAVIQYTGGTTGVPKGAMLTHQNVVANVEQAVMWFYKNEPGQEKMVGVLPFFHVFAMTAVLNMAVRCAFEIIALPRFDLDQTLKLIDKKKPHYFPAVPAIYNAINNHSKLDSYDLKSLKYCISGGAPLPVEVKKAFESNTGCIVVEGYGLTESAPVVCVNPIEGENKPGSIGMPVPGTTVILIDPETGKEVAQGEPGELCVSGPQVMKGYYKKEADTNDMIKNGYLYTGDIAHVDEQGYFFIVDRIKDLIITNGYNVYPRHVEEAIYLHPGVEECIVAGVPDKARGEVVKAWIKPKDGYDISVEDMKGFLEDKISKIEIPRQFEIRDEALPKTMIGKLSRKDILEQEKKEKSE